MEALPVIKCTRTSSRAVHVTPEKKTEALPDRQGRTTQ